MKSGEKSAGNTHASQHTCARPVYSCPLSTQISLRDQDTSHNAGRRAGGDRLCRPAAGSRWLARCRVAFDLGPRGRLNIIGVLRRFHLSAAPWSRCFALTVYGCFIQMCHMEPLCAPSFSCYRYSQCSLSPNVYSNKDEFKFPRLSMTMEIRHKI